MALPEPADRQRRWRPYGRCEACGCARFTLSKLCRRRTCPGYGLLWAGDQRRKLFTNLRSFLDGSARVVLLTLTAPGAEALPWDIDHCRALGAHTCSGELGCRVQQAAADAWNEECADQWRRLHRRVHQDVKKLAPGLWMLVRVFELQRRGVLHVHPVLAFGTPAQKAAAHLYLRRLVQLAPEYKFGFAERKLEPIAAGAAAAYLSAYFVTGKKEKLALHESVASPAMPRSIIWVSPRLTQATGCTMRELRYRRFVWRCAGGWIDIGWIKTARCIAQAHAYFGAPPPFRIVLKILHRRLDDDPPS